MSAESHGCRDFERPLAHGILLLVVVYLTGFVGKGWIPHDEGMIGQLAEQAAAGRVPHLDFEDPYTGGLSWLYGLTFSVLGPDLLHIRWLLFAAAFVSILVLYRIFRRFSGPLGAACASGVAVLWSLPNYFAGLPSWWLLFAALLAVWSLCRFVERQQLRYAMLAGVSAGIGVTIKQTGTYVVVALALCLLYCLNDAARSAPWLRYVERAVRWSAALLSTAFAAAILGPRLWSADGAYLFPPILGCAAALVLRREQDTPRLTLHGMISVVVALICASIPIILLTVPYLIRGDLWSFMQGAIVLPRARLVYASVPMPSAVFLILGFPALAAISYFQKTRSLPKGALAIRWYIAIILPAVAMFNVLATQITWVTARAIGTLLPLALCWRLTFGQVREHHNRMLCFIGAAMVSWAALNQFPFAAPIYFCYITPLLGIAIAAYARSDGGRLQNNLPTLGSLALFAILIMNTGYVQLLDIPHETRQFDTPLGISRANLLVEAPDAETYGRVTALIAEHLQDGRLIAGPDCPEVYFLSGEPDRSGRLFDALANDFSSSGDESRRWIQASVAVVNSHPEFSPRLAEPVLTLLRRELPHSERVGKFEVRWR